MNGFLLSEDEDAQGGSTRNGKTNPWTVPEPETLTLAYRLSRVLVFRNRNILY